MPSELPFEAERIERIGWLIRLRWLAVLASYAVLAAAWIVAPGTLPFRSLLYVITLVGLYNAGLWLYARTLRSDIAGDRHSSSAVGLASLQIVLDLPALAALIHFSGGVENPMILFFVLHTTVASVLLPRRLGFAMVALAAVLLAAVGGLEYSGLLPHHHVPFFGEMELYSAGGYVAGFVGMMIVTLGLVNYLTASISARLRARDRALMQRHREVIAKSRELEEVNERLREIDAERTRFLTVVTHELRAPIHTIHTCIELALSGHAPPDKARDLLERVMRRTEEVSQLVSDLLRLARAREEARRDEPLSAVNPAGVLRSVVDLMRTEAESKDLFLSMDVDPDLLPVRANPDRLKLVWTNLLSNAIKYTEPGGIVAVTIKQGNEHMIASVRDTGIGISAEDQQSMFQEFFRAGNARDVCPIGTGVGLALVRRIVENLGGKVWVESELGLGSKFSFLLPSERESSELAE
ncbi:MAG TPA: HAMP domain-containing histidine kinase [Halothiobacillaceae bacterium]|nr:HAMP domain-containing histidine kinase [Halothiobacillaceae bacterium]